MAIRPILTLPDKRLRQIADPIETIDDEIKTLAKDMLETMYAAPGVGLAATQIGEMKRLVLREQGLDEGDPVGDDARDLCRLLLGDPVRVMEKGEGEEC